MIEPVIIIHGGAWAIPANLSDTSRRGVKCAAKIGYNILKSGGSALDAVEAAIISLEDDPTFDAGKGSCLNAAGKFKMTYLLYVCYKYYFLHNYFKFIIDYFP